MRVRYKLLHTTLSELFKGIRNDRDAVALAEACVEYGFRIIARVNGLESPEHVLAITPNAGTARLLNAIDAHIGKTKEAGDAVVMRLIACLGSQAAYGSLPH